MILSRSSVRALRVCLRFCVPLFAASGGAFALADAAPERERLAGIVRQLDLIDRLAEGAAYAASRTERYHFDYLRLREDIERVRAGVRDYLSPPRAQPRDLAPLAGEYRSPGPQETP